MYARVVRGKVSPFEATVTWNQEQIAKLARLFAASEPPVVEQYQVAVEE